MKGTTKITSYKAMQKCMLAIAGIFLLSAVPTQAGLEDVDYTFTMDQAICISVINKAKEGSPKIAVAGKFTDLFRDKEATTAKDESAMIEVAPGTASEPADFLAFIQLREGTPFTYEVRMQFSIDEQVK